MSGIVETVVAGLLTSEVQGVVGSVKSRIVEEIQLAWGFQKELEELKGQFTTLSELLQGASGMRVTNQLMADWLKKIKDVAEEADNLLDEWSYKALEQRTQTGCWDLFVHIISQPFYSLAMAHKVKDIRKLIDGIYHDAKELGIKPVEAAAGEVNTGTQAREIEIQDNRLNNLRECVDLQLFQGRDYDLEMLVNLLCDPNNTNSHLIVIGIVGLAGLGKTTLSKHISESQEVTHFYNSLVIWLVVSHNFDLMDLLKRMVEILFGEASNMRDKQALILKLQTKMKGKKYLLILDDVWDTIQWEPLKCTLNEIGVSQGSTLLVTSRDKKVVEKLYTSKKPIIYELQELSPGNSWSLFKAKFCDGIVDGSEEEQIAKRMIGKCGGVPLAIRVLADLLRGKSIEEWREIEESEIWNKNDILPSLRLSYNYLPYLTLKKCFAYCAIFKEDKVIRKQKLIYMWMAQGFLQPYDNNMEHTGSIKKNMEHTGEEYIEHLLSCSLFQEVERDEYGMIETFKMHDLVWTLARSVSMRECLCVCSENDAVTDEVRHLSIQRDVESRELASKSLTKLKTYLVGNYVWESDSLQFVLTCKHLRVLNVGRQACESLNWKPLRSLIHLRYFAIKVIDHKVFNKSNLPNQIMKLHHLQTLGINSSYHEYDPDPPVAAFLRKISNLVNLRHVSIYHCIGIPIGLSHLTALQTLPIIKLGLNWGGNISDIGLFTNLRGKLEIHCLRLLTIVEARSMDLVSKSNLDNLVLKWGIGKKNPKANEILEALQPHENLRKLRVQYFDGTAFPKWLMGPGSPLNNIVSLQISDCEEADGDLKLENFIRLRTLKVEVCGKLTVTFSNDRSQCCKYLEELEIVWCDKVEELPDLLLMPKLKAIKIRGNNSTSRDVLEGLGSLSHLKELWTDLKLPVDLGEDSPVCKSLEDLTLFGSKYNNGDTTTDLPEQLQHLVALQCLWITDFESVEAIPNWLGKLTSLIYLYLYDMPKLKQLPPQDVMQSLSNLSSLNCSGCPILEEDFKNKSGEWFKISHIRHIWWPE